MQMISRMKAVEMQFKAIRSFKIAHVMKIIKKISRNLNTEENGRNSVVQSINKCSSSA